MNGAFRASDGFDPDDGPLSHSSIVAREYGIPAVLGTGIATRRIRSGQRLRVDGDAGTVQLLDDAGADAAADEPAASRSGIRVVLGVGTVLGLAWWMRRRRS